MIIPDYVERHARLYPEKIAMVFEDRQCNYFTLQERVYRLANGLIRLGLKEGDRVAVLSENCFEFLEIYLRRILSHMELDNYRGTNEPAYFLAKHFAVETEPEI